MSVGPDDQIYMKEICGSFVFIQGRRFQPYIAILPRKTRLNFSEMHFPAGFEHFFILISTFEQIDPKVVSMSLDVIGEWPPAFAGF